MRRFFLSILVCLGLGFLIAGCAMNDGSNNQNNVNENAVIANEFFWGSWVRMDSGKEYTVKEYKLVSSSEEHWITETSKNSLTVSNLGTFRKESDSVIICDNIPYFRKGGANLEYSLKLVGFSDSRALSSIPKSGLKGTGKSSTYTSFVSESESDSDGVLKMNAPTVNDVQTVTIGADGMDITVPNIKITNTGDFMGTVAIVSHDQYNLKITGVISDDQKDNGYLYGNNAKTYRMVLSITNISNVKCSASVCTVTADSPLLSISSSANLEGIAISTLAANATKTIEINVSCGDILDKGYMDTGLNVEIHNAKTEEKWNDYVPLRFYKGLIPITVAAKSPEDNNQAALNGFIMYPDGNNQFFSVKNNSSSILLVPAFGSNAKYKMVFSGATVTSTLSNSTEMFYSVAPGKSLMKEIDLVTNKTELLSYMTYGGDNNKEEKAFFAESDFVAYLSEGEIDYYTLNADSEEFYAPGAKNFYKVSYQTEYGTAPSDFFIAEDSYLDASKLPELEEDGKKFQGWYIGSSIVTPGSFKITNNTVLVAKWTSSFRVTYSTEYGTAPAPIIVGEGEYFTSAQLPQLEYDGLFFNGWYIDDLFITEKNYTVKSDITLTARWSEKCMVTYSSSYGTTPVPIIVAKGSNLTASDFPKLKETGWSFKGWFIGESKIEEGYTVNSNITLNAKWEEFTSPDDGFVYVEGGTFKMGSSTGYGDEQPVHSVTLSSFYMSPTELTQGEYEKYCTYSSSSPSSSYGKGSDYPVYYVNWYDALVYCNNRSKAEGLTPCYKIKDTTDTSSWGSVPASDANSWDNVICDFTANGYRLPTEAEWEYAARGGNKSNGYTYSGSDSIGDVAWYNGNSSSTHQVGTKSANELGIYDMSGNVWEWCWDWYSSRQYEKDSAGVTNPRGASSSSARACRGGSYYNVNSYGTVSFRSSNTPYKMNYLIGFRLVRSF